MFKFLVQSLKFTSLVLVSLMATVAFTQPLERSSNYLQGEDLDHELVVLGALQVGRQRLPRSEDIQHQLLLGHLREDGR